MTPNCANFLSQPSNWTVKIWGPVSWPFLSRRDLSLAHNTLPLSSFSSASLFAHSVWLASLLCTLALVTPFVRESALASISGYF